MMRGELVVVGACELVDKPFEAWRTLEVYQLPALYADEVVVMRFERVCELITLFESNLNDIDDSELRKQLESAVNTGALGELAGTQNLLQC